MWSTFSIHAAGGGKKVKFSLGGDGDDGISLTHGGKSILGDAEDLLGAPELDDIDDAVAEEMMKDYNFGGGEGDDAVAKGPDGKPKTRKEVTRETRMEIDTTFTWTILSRLFFLHPQCLYRLFFSFFSPSSFQVMEEIIAKSKAYKAMKQKQKEEDEDAMEKLDADYRQLLSTRALAAYAKPKGYTK